MTDLYALDVLHALRSAGLVIRWRGTVASLRRESITQVGRAGVGLSRVVKRGGA